MLYDRWCDLAGQRRDEFALADVASGKRWTFGQLRDAGHRAQIPQTQQHDDIAFPQGQSAGFILALLAAWRTGRVTCPLETGQTPAHVIAPPRHCMHLKSTSATTGAPRLIAFTAEQLAADAENILFTMGLRPDWPNLGVISLAHSYGFSNLVLPLLLHGIPLILAPSPLPEMLRRTAAGWPALTLPAVPAMWHAWREAQAIPPNVCLAISAGAPLAVTLEQAVYARSELKLHNFYGSSECGGIAFDATNTPRNDPSLVGSAMHNVRLSLNESRCLIVRSAAVAETYWPQREENLGEGQFQSADLAEIVDDTVYLRGRASDLINVAGRKISPEQIEFILNQHPAVAASLVFGVPDPHAERGECIVATVVTRAPATAEILRQFLLQQLEAWQVPREWWFVPSLTPNARGKLSRAEWRQRFLERHSA